MRGGRVLRPSGRLGAHSVIMKRCSSPLPPPFSCPLRSPWVCCLQNAYRLRPSTTPTWSQPLAPLVGDPAGLAHASPVRGPVLHLGGTCDQPPGLPTRAQQAGGLPTPTFHTVLPPLCWGCHLANCPLQIPPSVEAPQHRCPQQASWGCAAAQQPPASLSVSPGACPLAREKGLLTQ